MQIFKKYFWNLSKKTMPIIIGMCIIIGFAYKIGISSIIQVISTVNIDYVILSAIVFIGALLLKSVRWHLFLKPVGINDLHLSTYSYFIGQLINELLPTGSGEIARIAVIKQQRSIGFMSLIPGIFLERFYDLVLLIILSVVLASAYLNYFLLSFVAIIIVIIMVIFIKPSVIKLIARYFSQVLSGYRLLSKLINIITSKLDELATSIEFYKQNKIIMLINIVLTIIAWMIFETLAQYLLLRAFNVNVPLMGLLGAISISWILGAASMIPGGLGVMEIVYALALSSLGIPFEIGASAAILYRVVICVLIVILGSLAYYFNHNKNKDIKNSSNHDIR